MPRFFHTIRRKLLVENKFSKYLIYAIGEIVLVVIGILIALQIDNHNDMKKDQDLANKYLTGFLNDYIKDSDRLTYLLDYRKKQKRSASNLLDYIDRNELVLDSFYHHFYLLFPFERFIPNENTLEEVLNSSHLRLISDDDVKTRILNLRTRYKQISLSEEHVYEDRAGYFYNAATLDNIEFKGVHVYMKGESFSASKEANVYREDAINFMKDRHFKSFLHLLVYNMEYQIPILEEVKDECAALIDLLNSGLKSK